MRLFSTEDGTAGIALKPDGDIVSGFVYADSPHKRAISSMLSQMVELGGDRLDAFDTVLPGIYANSGFKPVARVRWDNEFAPDGWDKETYSKFNNGEPDVVIMAYDSDRVGSEYDPTEGEVFDDYDAAMEARNTELEELKKEKEPDLSPDNEYADPDPGHAEIEANKVKFDNNLFYSVMIPRVLLEDLNETSALENDEENFIYKPGKYILKGDRLNGLISAIENRIELYRDDREGYSDVGPSAIRALKNFRVASKNPVDATAEKAPAKNKKDERRKLVDKLVEASFNFSETENLGQLSEAEVIESRTAMWPNSKAYLERKIAEGGDFDGSRTARLKRGLDGFIQEGLDSLRELREAERALAIFDGELAGEPENAPEAPSIETGSPGPVSRERPSFDAGISDFEVDDSELETGEEEDLSSAVKLKRLIANNPGLSRFINRMAKAPVRNPVKTLQSARDLKKALADLDVSDFEVEGFTPSVSHSGMSRSDINLIRDNLSANNITVSPEEARDLADILNYVINFEGMTTEEAVIAALKKDGIRYSNKNNIAVKSVDLPITFENEDSKELPDPKTAILVTTPKETKDILAAMGKINAFFESEGSLPGTLDPNAISIRVVPNQNAFDNLYNLLDITETGRIKSRATTFGANIPNLVELPVEEYLAGRIPLTDNRDLSSNIILNLKFLREYADKTKFESGSRIQETLIHEFGHTLHRSFGLSWGRKKTVSSLGEYYSVFKQFVSDYGTTSPKEHFSDSFSQYLLTGDSPQGWKAFMKSQGILK
jgi:hypothetical protein